MASVKSWLGRARGVNQPRTNLKKMREVLQAGLRLAAEVPQVEQLRMDIRRREWEENGKKVSSSNLESSCTRTFCVFSKLAESQLFK